eukprot:m.482705 g.482705  ORF g.482705 m.482705 type:complete len:639 (+) comp57192_c0_seq4:42-1958(+)
MRRRQIASMLLLCLLCAAQMSQATDSSESARLKKALLDEGTKLACTPGPPQTRLCRIRNLCFAPQPGLPRTLLHLQLSDCDAFVLVFAGEFVALLPAEATFSAAQDMPFSRPVDDYLLDLTAVLDHNMQQMHITELPAEALRSARVTPDSSSLPGVNQLSIAISEARTLIFKRFNPENIMHVLHDDLIPLFHTLQIFSGWPPAGTRGHHFIAADPLDHVIDRSVQLLYLDGRPPGQFAELFQLLSDKGALDVGTLPNADLVCFKEVLAGVSKQSLWYQYGFSRTQGPVDALNERLTGQIVSDFRRYALRRVARNISAGAEESLQVTESDPVPKPKVALFVRRRNRRILNVDELLAAVETTFGIDLVAIDLEIDSVANQIQVLQGCIGAIGMHGSLLIMGMFLPPNSFLLELFPFAVLPERYAPFKTMASLPALQLRYRAWANVNESNSIAFPDNPPHLGGLAHLNRNQRNQILSTKTVPPHLCCSDPAWLFRIYQDTRVNISEVVTEIRQLIDEQRQHEKAHPKRISRPSKVTAISCSEAAGALNVSWQPSWNLAHIMQSDPGMQVEYEVVIFETFQQVATSDTWTTITLQRNSRGEDQAPLQVLVRATIKYFARGTGSEDPVPAIGPFSAAVQCSQN